MPCWLIGKQQIHLLHTRARVRVCIAHTCACVQPCVCECIRARTHADREEKCVRAGMDVLAGAHTFACARVQFDASATHTSEAAV
jgi:biotin synthase-related radical SAM superfamily protein